MPRWRTLSCSASMKVEESVRNFYLLSNFSSAPTRWPPCVSGSEVTRRSTWWETIHRFVNSYVICLFVWLFPSECPLFIFSASGTCVGWHVGSKDVRWKFISSEEYLLIYLIWIISCFQVVVKGGSQPGRLCWKVQRLGRRDTGFV